MDIARTEAEKFMGREDELFRVKEYLLSARTGPFVVYGPTGSGKTCFISKVATLTGWYRMCQLQLHRNGVTVYNVSCMHFLCPFGANM